MTPSPDLRRMVDVLLVSEQIQRPALARQAGLPRQTVSELMSGLEMLGLVRVDGRFSGHPGRSGLSYALASNAVVALAFDIGGTKVAAALTDLRGAVLAEATQPTTTHSLPELLAQLGQLAAQLCRTAGIDRHCIRYAAIGVPGATHPVTRRVTMASNLGVVAEPALAERLEDELSCTVRLENDANMALIGESYEGVGLGHRNLAFVAIGTGVGAALMVDGRLLRGHRGGAGEIAFLPEAGLSPTVGGSFEATVGAAGIAAAYATAGGSSATSVELIFAGAAAGDVAAQNTLDALARRLAFGIAALASVADPELLVMGGAIGARPELIARIISAMPDYMHDPIPIYPSSHGARAGLVGALCVARLDLLESFFGAGPERPPW